MLGEIVLLLMYFVIGLIAPLILVFYIIFVLPFKILSLIIDKFSHKKDDFKKEKIKSDYSKIKI